MYQKRLDRVGSKKAQITVFIIVGMFILFAFVFVINLTSNLQEKQLQEAKESSISKLFKREAMRIFVEDCLNDELEKGLLLIGRQGRLWDFQPGGTKSFQEGVTGITYAPAEDGGLIFYAITNETYFSEPNAYPCNDEVNPPQFCKYHYPNTTVGFGNPQIIYSTLEEDLERYLVNRTTWCVENFIYSNISNKAIITTEKMALKLDILSGGINVEVDYPLKFSVETEEFFHLSRFDFFYPTNFKYLLDAAVLFPLQWDQKFVDFSYDEATLKSPQFKYGSEQELAGYCESVEETDYYSCQRSLSAEKYSSLGIQMSKQEVPGTGDDIFIFTSLGILSSPREFIYRFARQNRPPALDYVGRAECPDHPNTPYDYLVIMNDQEKPEMAKINITLHAEDPDEDEVSSGFVPPSQVSSIPEFPLFQDYLSGPELNVKEETINKLNPGIYSFFAYAADQHKQRDWQQVRVLIDREPKLDLSIDIPEYKLDAGDNYIPYADVFKDKGLYVVSTEDPAFVNYTVPQNSYVAFNEEKHLRYTDSNGKDSFELTVPASSDQTEFCLSLPWGLSRECNIEDYNILVESSIHLVKKWPLSNPGKLIKDPQMSNYAFKTKTNAGVMSVDYSSAYCNNFNDFGSAEKKIVVVGCIPHRNPAFPYAYPYHNYLFSTKLDKDGKEITDQFKANLASGKDENQDNNGAGTSPFLATHNCCEGYAADPTSWKVSGAGKVCFTNPEPGCYGEINDYKLINKNYGGYVLEEEFATCDEKRGNVCSGEPQYKLWKDKLVCGNSKYSECTEVNKVNTQCRGNESWGYVDSNTDKTVDVWCHGTMGCELPCSDVAVYIKEPKQLPPFLGDINGYAKNNPNIITDEHLNLVCGCAKAKEGSYCDINHNEKFEGICTNKVCILK